MINFMDFIYILGIAILFFFAIYLIFFGTGHIFHFLMKRINPEKYREVRVRHNFRKY